MAVLVSMGPVGTGAASTGSAASTAMGSSPSTSDMVVVVMVQLTQSKSSMNETKRQGEDFRERKC
jgi:hypothetical protein